ncbi:MAG: LacI family DNA-binding transcriptional regulator [Acidobacteria bacterium]|nr:LacI family DNA-binding transcriptional regulator [Acidobacteriota bacterium]
MRTRMKDIAQDLGVSLMTISKALRGHRDISDATRRRVIERASELDYRPNWVARSLLTGRTQLVGLIIPDLMHSFFAEVAKGIGRKLEPAGYHAVIFNSEENAEAEERQIQLLLARNVEGMILASAQSHGRHRQFQTLINRQMPCVLIDRMVNGVKAHFVGVRDEEVGFLATTHLIEQGCRRIAHIRGPAISTGVGRLRGYRRALAKAGIEVRPEYVVRGHSGDDSGYQAMRRLLSLPAKPDGIFCYNDPVAAGAIKAIWEAGLDVPRDVAIIGAGNIHYSDLLRVPLSTVDQGSSAIGETAAELFLHCIEAKSLLPPERILIPPKLVVRESTRRPR